MSKPNFLKHEIVFNPTGNEFDKARDQLLGTYKLVKVEDWEYKFIKQPKLSIPKKFAEFADKEFNQGDDVLGFGFSITEFGFANDELREWVTNDGGYDVIATGRANVLSAYLAGKTLGVELVEVEE
ncbi:hypothetical protein ET008_06355 [Lactococcus garvieae]|nr:hypothetical protein [Lactococcus garvieae]